MGLPFGVMPGSFQIPPRNRSSLNWQPRPLDGSPSLSALSFLALLVTGNDHVLAQTESRALLDSLRSRPIQLHPRFISRTPYSSKYRRARRILSSFVKSCAGVTGFCEGCEGETSEFELHIS
jgi:hypothetical protein